jgi:hypothetical protein
MASPGLQSAVRWLLPMHMCEYCCRDRGREDPLALTPDVNGTVLDCLNASSNRL